MTQRRSSTNLVQIVPATFGFESVLLLLVLLLAGPIQAGRADSTHTAAHCSL
jgi:hypothetical protein